MTTATGIVPRATLMDAVNARNAALSLYDDAWDRIETASKAITKAKTEARRASPKHNRFNAHNDDAKAAFLGGLPVPDREIYKREARRLVDTDVWAYVIELTDLERLMDSTAKEQFRAQLLKDPPEVTIENVQATLQQLYLDAGTIFLRGIANVFSKLDRRFRSHDGWKVGSRVVLTRALDDWGSWNYHRSERDIFRDIERTFHVLDEKPVPLDYVSIVALVEAQRSYGLGRRVGFIETDYFRVRTFMNGNLHVWFKRNDLLTKVNQLLGEFYGAPIPEAREAETDTGLHTPKTGLAKNYGFFPTPDEAADTAIGRVSWWRRDGEPKLRALEPSAGTGNLARRMLKAGAIVDAVEIQAELAADLRRKHPLAHVYNMDFLALTPETTGLYDVVVMNPPFDRERDIDHVMHAMKFLKPDGRLVAIMSAGTEFRETKKSIAFREFMAGKGADYRDLPPGSFASVGTYVNTVILTVNNDGRPARY